jgi:hypothetical protein
MLHARCMFHVAHWRKVYLCMLSRWEVILYEKTGKNEIKYPDITVPRKKTKNVFFILVHALAEEV